jgi:hypothetical protein
MHEVLVNGRRLRPEEWADAPSPPGSWTRGDRPAWYTGDDLRFCRSGGLAARVHAMDDQAAEEAHAAAAECGRLDRARLRLARLLRSDACAMTVALVSALAVVLWNRARDLGGMSEMRIDVDRGPRAFPFASVAAALRFLSDGRVSELGRYRARCQSMERLSGDGAVRGAGGARAASSGEDQVKSLPAWTLYRDTMAAFEEAAAKAAPGAMALLSLLSVGEWVVAKGKARQGARVAAAGVAKRKLVFLPQQILEPRTWRDLVALGHVRASDEQAARHDVAAARRALHEALVRRELVPPPRTRAPSRATTTPTHREEPPPWL